MDIALTDKLKTTINTIPQYVQNRSTEYNANAVPSLSSCRT